MKVTEAGKSYDVVIIGSPNVNDGYKPLGIRHTRGSSPTMNAFRVLKSLPVDIFSAKRMAVTSIYRRNIRG
jgi:metallo-beta-lactamase class B